MHVYLAHGFVEFCAVSEEVEWARSIVEESGVSCDPKYPLVQES